MSAKYINYNAVLQNEFLRERGINPFSPKSIGGENMHLLDFIHEKNRGLFEISAPRLSKFQDLLFLISSAEGPEEVEILGVSCVYDA
ncbi:MAG: hypothetical protein PHQ39_12890 [Methanothrix soehngenii]|nr:hypothetical protein [Methanothrix soehngenii]